MRHGCRFGLTSIVLFASTTLLVGCRSRSVAEIAAGKDNTCMRTADGRVYCWGDDAYTQSKNPSFAANPGKRTAPKRVNGVDDAKAIALAASHGCAAISSGGVRCFLDVDLEGVSISGVDAERVRAFSAGACVRTAGGEGKCFKGETREIPRTPADPPAGLGPIVDIVTGDRHVCVAHPDGTVSCFGDDRVGQLGTLAAAPPVPPVPPVPGAAVPPPPQPPRKLDGLKDVTALAAGHGHTCALQKGGRVLCWGMNELGQLGHVPRSAGETITRVPTVVEGIEGAVAVAAGYYHSCAIVADGGVMCWGSNHHGELGRPATRAVLARPERVEGLSGVKQVACGEWHTCALLGNGSVKCWGRNHRGQLGTGNNTDSHKPVDIKMP